MLRHVADVLRGELRETDTLARIGGEEFAIILPGVEEEQTIPLLNRLRERVEASPLPVGGAWLVQTISAGVASALGEEKSSETLLHEADTALYVAKKCGRNRVVRSSAVDQTIAIADVTGLRRAQQEVIDSHARLDALYRHASLGMAMVDGKGRYLQANSEFCRIVGYSEDELCCDQPPILTPAEYAARDARAVVDACLGARGKAYEKELLHSSGKRVPVMVMTTVVGGSDGSHRWIVVEDVTERKREQRAVQEANATNESLIAAMPDMLFQLDGDMRIVRYHADKPDLTVPPEAFMGKRLDEVLSARTARAFFNAVHAAGRSGQLQRLEYSSRRGADRLRHFEARLRMVPTGGALVVIRDMTDQKETELALRESEARWQFALDGAGDGVWDWNIAENRVFRSDRCKTMLGYAVDELPDDHASWAALVHPEDLPALLEARRIHLKGESPMLAMEVRTRARSGRYKWVLVRGLVECGDSGWPNVIGFRITLDGQRALATWLGLSLTKL